MKRGVDAVYDRRDKKEIVSHSTRSEIMKMVQKFLPLKLYTYFLYFQKKKRCFREISIVQKLNGTLKTFTNIIPISLLELIPIRLLR